MDIQVGQPSKLLRLKLIRSVQLKWFKQSIALTNAGSILVLGSLNRISIWSFFSEFKLLRKTYCKGNFTKIVFSKKMNWFATTSPSQIQSWKEQSNGEWVGSEIKRYKNNFVYDLLLNNSEDQIITCGTSILVWNVNRQANSIEFYYALDIKEDFIYCINLNQSKTKLVSSSENNVFLWSKGQDDKWQYSTKIILNRYLGSVYFFNDYQIACKPWQKNVTNICEIQNDRLLNLDKNLKARGGGWFYRFPTFFNKRKQLFIQRHYQFIYFLQRQENGELKIISDQIEMKGLVSMAFVVDKKFLVVLINSIVKVFKV